MIDFTQYKRVSLPLSTETIPVLIKCGCIPELSFRSTFAFSYWIFIQVFCVIIMRFDWLCRFFCEIHHKTSLKRRTKTNPRLAVL